MYLLFVNMENKVLNVRKWIEDLPKRGRITFSMDEAESRFSYMPKKAVRSSIYRLIKNNRIYSAWRGFYVIVTDDHALRGIVPPIEYIESLMTYTRHKYYVGLLSAAAIYGAGHQQPQILTVVTDSNDIRSNKNKFIMFLAKAKISETYLIEKRAGQGKVLISSPELTAIDLIQYENRIGGLNRVVDILSELELDFKKINVDFWRMIKTPIIQRLGFLLESVLGFEDLGADVFLQAQAAGVHFRKTPLDSGIKPSVDDLKEDLKWKITINCELEINV